MRSRIEFSNMLKEVTGATNVYFQPPDSTKMRYPAIVYSRDDIRNTHADNSVYMTKTTYQITVIDSNPDSDLVYKIAMIPEARFVRHYTSDNLNHDVFSITY